MNLKEAIKTLATIRYSLIVTDRDNSRDIIEGYMLDQQAEIERLRNLKYGIGDADD